MSTALVKESYFTGEHLSKLERMMHSIQVANGAYLFWEGDEPNKLFYIISGQVKLIKTTEDGRNLILSVASKGDLIGELGGEDNRFQTYSAEVTEQSEIGVIDYADVEQLLKEDGEFAVCFMKWLSNRSTKMQTKLRDLLLFGKMGAVASTLIRMSNTFGVTVEDGILLEARFNHTELAEMIGATRESVNRMLSSLRSDGIISMDKGQIIIHDIKSLRSICNCPVFPACPPEICRL